MNTKRLDIEFIKLTVDNIYTEIEKNTSPEMNIALIGKYDLKSEHINRNKYPVIEFQISHDEIKQMIVNKIIDCDGNIKIYSASGDMNLTSLEKLLYSILWKEGDINKIKYIIKGIKNDKSNIEKGQVFFQFGRFLSDKKEPIIDQHVIRTSMIRNAIEITAIEKAISINQLDKKNIQDVEKYIEWIDSICKDSENRKDILISIDEVLFALGKKIKKGKLTTAST